MLHRYLFSSFLRAVIRAPRCRSTHRQMSGYPCCHNLSCYHHMTSVCPSMQCFRRNMSWSPGLSLTFRSYMHIPSLRLCSLRHCRYIPESFLPSGHSPLSADPYHHTHMRSYSLFFYESASTVPNLLIYCLTFQ